MKRHTILNGRLKKAGIIFGIMLMLGGVAFALLQSRSVITGNTISTASADLLLSTDGVHYSHTVPGFNFGNLIPAGYAAPKDGYPIYLKNAGNTTLDLSLALDDTPSGATEVDLDQINIGLTDASGTIPPRGAILGELLHGSQPIRDSELAPGAVRQYKFQALAADDAKPGMVISNIDLAFIGTARDPNDPNQ